MLWRVIGSKGSRPRGVWYAIAPVLAGLVVVAGLVAYNVFQRVYPAAEEVWSVFGGNESLVVEEGTWHGLTSARKLRRGILEAAAVGRDVLGGRLSPGAPLAGERLEKARKQVSVAIREYESVHPREAASPQWQQVRRLVDQYWTTQQHLLTLGARQLADPKIRQDFLEHLSTQQNAIFRQVETIVDIHLAEVSRREREVAAAEKRIPLHWALLICTALVLVLIVLPLVHAWITRRLLHEQLRETLKTKKALRELSTQLMNTQEDERRHLSRELHDEIGQALTAARLDLAMLERSIPPQLGDLQGIAHDGRLLVEQTLHRVRDLTQGLRPSLLDEEGLAPAVKWLIKRFGVRTGIEVTFKTAGPESRLPPRIETTAFRLIQECLTNILKHSGATRVEVSIVREDAVLRLRVKDNGSGVKPPEAGKIPEGIGLLGIRERVEGLGGRVDTASAPGEGFCLTGEIPLRFENEPVQAAGKTW